MSSLIDQTASLITRGGPVMVPLIVLSFISLTLIIERAVFWIAIHRPRTLRRVRRLNELLRRGDRAACLSQIKTDRSPYGDLARRLLEDGANDAVASEAVEDQRGRLERSMVLLSTIITAAPLLGILGTVIGIIQSFKILGEQSQLTDPRDVSAGIASALLTTAFGLVIALMTLFPFMLYRKQVDRAMGRLESTIAAAEQGVGSSRGEQKTERAPAPARQAAS